MRTYLVDVEDGSRLTIVVAVDWDKLATKLVQRAAKNKTGRASALRGAVYAKVTTRVKTKERT